MDLADTSLYLLDERGKERIAVPTDMVDLVDCFFDVVVPVLKGPLKVEGVTHVGFVGCNVSH